MYSMYELHQQVTHLIIPIKFASEESIIPIISISDTPNHTN